MRASPPLSYGPDRADMYRRAPPATSTASSRREAGQLPVQAPVKYELAINLKTAKALGLAVPDTLLATADEVIE